MTTTAANQWTLTLSEEERLALLALLNQAVQDIHVERRRTEAPEYHTEVVRHEAVLRSLADKVRQLKQ